LPAATYKQHSEIFDDHDIDDATSIITATNGNLPIIVLETDFGRLIVGMGSDGHLIKCEDGSCKI
jgi:adenosine/AMP kinase